MRTEVIRADSIDVAVEGILGKLKEDTNATRSVSSRNNVIYFDGWDGLGTSTVLGAVAQRLGVSSDAPAGLQFDQIIQVDCSKWESMRELQRVIAEKLQLPAWVMEMFDRQDEEDDFHGLAKGSRAEIPQVLEAMYQHIQKLNRRFLIVFQNGSSHEVNLSVFGFPLSGYSRNKVLWTFQGRFRLMPRTKVDEALNNTGATDVFLWGSHHEKDPHELWSYLVRLEAADIASNDAGGVNQLSQVVDCFLYMWKLSYMGHQFRIDYDLATHGCNYWLCDGIIQLDQADSNGRPWSAASALERELRLDVDYYHHSQQPLPSNLVRCADTMATLPYWTSPPYGVVLFQIDDMLRHCDRLGVLKLSRCTFSFSSPPFLCCRSLRFLWLDRCEDQAISTTGVAEEEDIKRCFERLWVLDVRYTCCDRILSAKMMDLMTHLRELNVVGAKDWDMGQLQGRMPNIRKLRVTKSTIRCSDHSRNELFLGMNKMVLLDFSGNSTTHDFQNLSGISTSSNFLENATISDGGCIGIQKICFRGCAKLKNLLLSGLFEGLHILDLSGTAVRTLDLRAMIVPKLDELFLDDCENLCAILWPPEDKRKTYLKKLHIDTSQSAVSLLAPKEESTTEGRTTTETSWESLSVTHSGRVPSKFDWFVSVRDARLLRSLAPFQKCFDDKGLHMEISSVDVTFVGSGKDNEAVKSRSSNNQPKENSTYTDVAVSFKDSLLLQESQGDSGASIYPLGAQKCYMHLQDRQPRRIGSLQDGEDTSITIPDMICYSAFILHVHDSLSMTSIPGPAPALSSTWRCLRWCRVERCPKLECVFTTPQFPERSDMIIFYFLKVLWASELPKARYIWNWSTPLVFRLGSRSFEDLKLLHLDLCPRVIHVLPLAMPMVQRSLVNLVTLEILWCGGLKVVFPLYTDADGSRQYQEQPITWVTFLNLKRIHLHELPKLQGICGSWRMYTPELESVKIRGCWSLKQLPAISSNRIKKVECDCEKEWWEKLEWDMDARHRPSLYKPTHSRYYKKTLLRGSVLI